MAPKAASGSGKSSKTLKQPVTSMKVASGKSAAMKASPKAKAAAKKTEAAAKKAGAAAKKAEAAAKGKKVQAKKAGTEKPEAEGEAVPKRAAGKKKAAPAAAEEVLADAAPAQAPAPTPEAMKKPAAAKAAAKKAAEPAREQPAGRPLSKTQELINAIHRTIASIPYHAAPAAGVQLHPAALTSLDPAGYPSTRTMIPSFVAPDLSEIRMTTRRGTRKEAEIVANPKVSLHFQDQRARGGWVTLKGEAKIRAASDSAEDVDIVLRPDRCEVVSYVEGAMADEDGWKPAVLIRPPGGDGWRRVH